jgi:signal transduction histidine kinase
VRRSLGLRGRFTAALLAISLLTLLAAAVSLLVPLRSQLRADALASLEQTARTARPSFEALPPTAFRRDSPRLLDAATRLRRRTRAEVVVVDAHGTVLAATGLDDRRPLSDVAAAVREQRLVSGIVNTGDESEARVAIPLTVAGQTFGLALRKPLGDLTAAELVVRRAFPVAAVIALVAALAAGFALASGLVSRLRALRDTSLRVAEVGLVAEVQADDRRDEVGDLTRAFATMQGRLREQERARRTFVSTASHELRTPLTSLRLILDTALDDLDPRSPDLEDARDQLGRAIAQADRLSKLTAELLNLSRLDAGMDLRAELVDLDEVARSVLAEFEPHAAHGRARAELVAVEPCWALADPGAVAQVLRILLDNALRHAPPDDPVSVTLGHAGDMTTVRVADAGPGVPESEREQVFERFRRGSTVAAGDGGFGLGLAIGRELARRMGGELRLEPDRRGATFTLELPPGDPRPADAAPA